MVQDPLRPDRPSDEYRQRAKACLDWATQTSNQEARLVCLQLAQAWLKAAMDEDRGEPPTRT
jgi:hypothetical protein